MALIQCKDCEKQFSTDALRCPNCGARRPVSQAAKRFWQIWGAGMVGVFIWFQIDMALESPEEKAAREHDNVLHAAGYACRSYAKNSLNDPDSAVFENPIVTPVINRFVSKPVVNRFEVTVSLRARNAYGAMLQGVMSCTVDKTGDRYTVIDFRQF